MQLLYCNIHKRMAFHMPLRSARIFCRLYWYFLLMFVEIQNDSMCISLLEKSLGIPVQRDEEYYNVLLTIRGELLKGISKRIMFQ